jgi:hypothetical protein
VRNLADASGASAIRLRGEGRTEQPWRAPVLPPRCGSVARGAEPVDHALRNTTPRRDIDSVGRGPGADGLGAVVGGNGRSRPAGGDSGSALSATNLARISFAWSFVRSISCRRPSSAKLTVSPPPSTSLEHALTATRRRRQHVHIRTGSGARNRSDADRLSRRTLPSVSARRQRDSDQITVPPTLAAEVQKCRSA